MSHRDEQDKNTTALELMIKSRIKALKEEECDDEEREDEDSPHIGWRNRGDEQYEESFITQAMKKQEISRPDTIDLTCDEKMPPPRKRKAKHKAEEKAKKLKISAKKVCITIARCQEDLQSIADAFEDKWGICQYKIVEELHEDGFPHIHAGLKFRERKQITSNEIVVAGKRYVMNFQMVSKEKGGWKGWLEYLDKHNPIKVINTLKDSSNLMGAENKEELLSLLIEDMGQRKAMMSWDRIYSCWEQFSRKKYEWVPVFPLDSYKIPFFLKTVKVVLTGLNTRRQVIVIIGPTRLGKTQMIRTMYHQSGHGYCRSRHNFQEWLTTSGPMILDDLDDGQAGSTTKTPNKGWTDSQPFNMTGKYKKTTEMAPRQVFILTNEDPNWVYDAYWKKNAHVIRIDGKLWK